MDGPASLEWRALAREAGIAAELMASGATLLGKASSAQHGLYNQAFFNLSIGLERAAKLAIVVDYCLTNSGKFPTDDELQRYRHDLDKLLAKVGEIAQRRSGAKSRSKLPGSGIHKAIIQVLSDFAQLTRYYNLDVLTEGKSASLKDPLAAWSNQVGGQILKAHYKPAKRERDEQQAKLLQAAMGKVAHVHQYTEEGKLLDSLEQARLHAARTEMIQKHGQLYVLQIVRWFAYLFSDLTRSAYEQHIETIPDLNDFFAIFRNEDRYFRNRKTWSIYRP